jgi:hypothetical protein
MQPVNGGNGLSFRFRDDLAICLEFLVSFVGGGLRQFSSFEEDMGNGKPAGWGS